MSKASPKDPSKKPLPTIFKGGIERLIEIWEDARNICTGYGDEHGKPWLKGVWCDRRETSRWWEASMVGTKTTCSPWTGTVIAQMFDQGYEAGDKGSPLKLVGSKPATAKVWYPMYNAGLKPMPNSFYVQHNNNNDSVGSCVDFNIGYEISPLDARRGDLVHMDHKKSGGHTGFIWDVHLTGDPNDPKVTDTVDCFTIIACNGNYVDEWYLPGDKGEKKTDVGREGALKYVRNAWKESHKGIAPSEKEENIALKALKKRVGYTGAGVSISAAGKPGLERFGTPDHPKSDNNWRKKEPGKKYCDDNIQEYVRHGNWTVVPGVNANSIDMSTFRFTPRKPSDSEKKVVVVRFWGTAPPKRPPSTPREAAMRAAYDAQRQRIEDNKGLYPDFKEVDPPKPYAWAKNEDSNGRAIKPQRRMASPPIAQPLAKAVQPMPVKKADVARDPLAHKKVDTSPIKQAKEAVAAHQIETEEALLRLHRHGWIAAGPGDTTNVGDAETTAAIKDFQAKFMPKVKATGLLDRKTRDTLLRVVWDLDQGKGNPNVRDVAPTVASAHTDTNHVQPGGQARVVVQGANLHPGVFASVRMRLSNLATGASRYCPPAHTLRSLGRVSLRVIEGGRTGRQGMPLIDKDWFFPLRIG